MTTIIVTVVVSVSVTTAGFLLWIWHTRRNHRGGHATYDRNKSPAALARMAAEHLRGTETHREFLARIRAHQARRDNPHFDGRHAAAEPDGRASGGLARNVHAA